jgi:ATP-dependent Lhr-like helicase
LKVLKRILPARVADYDPRWLDALSLTGVLGWGRLSPHPAFYAADSGGPRRVVPTSMAPVTFFLREEALWMDLCLAQRQIPEAKLACCLSELALKLRTLFETKGALFAADLVRALAAPPPELTRALWELVAAGLVTADCFDSLRMLIDPRRKQAFTAHPAARRGAPKSTAGRWSLLAPPEADLAPTAGERAEQHKAQIASACRMLLGRYGIVFRDVLARESTIPLWRELLPMLRRMEARGEVRGGRFLSGFGGEQFALPEALDSLRAAGRAGRTVTPVTVCAADPLNLVGIVIPGERVSAISGNSVTYDEESFAGISPAVLSRAGQEQQLEL